MFVCIGSLVIHHFDVLLKIHDRIIFNFYPRLPHTLVLYDNLSNVNYHIFTKLMVSEHTAQEWSNSPYSTSSRLQKM